MNQILTSETWNKSKISDPVYEQKFNYLPSIISEWVGGLQNKDVLDFGCGEATTALGVALQHEAKRVVGIDIMPDPDLCATYASKQLGLSELPRNLHLHRVEPGRLHKSDDKFDVIYSWSVFEHVEQRILSATLEMLKTSLKPGGRLFIQISPLFYSADGGHLMCKVPEPWGHLTNQHSVYLEKVQAACSTPEEYAALKSMFETLNHMTASRLIGHAKDGGFRVLQEYRTERNDAVPAELLDIYQRDILMNEQIVLLLEAV